MSTLSTETIKTLDSSYNHAKRNFRAAYVQARREGRNSSEGIEYWRSIMRQYRVHLNNERIK